MAESYTQDISDLWGRYRAQGAIVDSLQAALGTLAAGGNPDVSGWSGGGEAGSESVSQATLTVMLDAAIERMSELRLLAIKATPGITIRRIPNGQNWRGW